MISEERFKKLLNDNQNIYWVNDDRIRFLKCSAVPTFWKNKWEFYEQVLFETEEDAEEYLKYGNITRTEKFPYVSWEDACDGTNHHIVFTTPKHQKIEMIICDGHIDIISSYTSISDFSEPLTKENYYKALDLAVKLFKGEEV